MALVIPLDELRSSPTASLFEGSRHAEGVEISCFVVDTTPGRGPLLHTHPYPEVFVVLEGEATFTVGDEEVVVTGGNVAIAPGETPHKFINSGDGPLKMVNIHQSGEVVQTDLEG